MLVVVGGDVGFVLWLARIGLVAESASEGAESGARRVGLDHNKLVTARSKDNGIRSKIRTFGAGFVK